MRRRNTVVLDLDGTLVDEKRDVNEAFAAVGRLVQRATGVEAHRFASTARVTARRLWWKPGWLDSLSDEFGLSSWDGLSATYDGAVSALGRLRDWLPAYRHATWTLTLRRCDAPDTLAATVGEAFVACRRSHGYPLPGAVDLVKALVPDRRLVVLTNGSAADQRRKLANVGLSMLLPDVIVSTEIGVAKPNPAAMDTALDRAGTTAKQAIMVGDSYDRDVRSALARDMPAIWITAGRRHYQPIPHLVTSVASTAEVLTVLRQLESDGVG